MISTMFLLVLLLMQLATSDTVSSPADPLPYHRSLLFHADLSENDFLANVAHDHDHPDARVFLPDELDWPTAQVIGARLSAVTSEAEATAAANSLITVLKFDKIALLLPSLELLQVKLYNTTLTDAAIKHCPPQTMIATLIDDALLREVQQCVDQFDVRKTLLKRDLFPSIFESLWDSDPLSTSRTVRSSHSTCWQLLKLVEQAINTERFPETHSANRRYVFQSLALLLFPGDAGSRDRAIIADGDSVALSKESLDALEDALTKFMRAQAGFFNDTPIWRRLFTYWKHFLMKEPDAPICSAVARSFNAVVFDDTMYTLFWAHVPDALQYAYADERCFSKFLFQKLSDRTLADPDSLRQLGLVGVKFPLSWYVHPESRFRGPISPSLFPFLDLTTTNQSFDILLFGTDEERAGAVVPDWRLPTAYALLQEPLFLIRFQNYARVVDKIFRRDDVSTFKAIFAQETMKARVLSQHFYGVGNLMCLAHVRKARRCFRFLIEALLSEPIKLHLVQKEHVEDNVPSSIQWAIDAWTVDAQQDGNLLNQLAAE